MSILTAYFTRVALLELDSTIVFSFITQIVSVVCGYVLMQMVAPSDFVILSRKQFVDLVLPLGNFFDCFDGCV